jgi:hypothetical protein
LQKWTSIRDYESYRGTNFISTSLRRFVLMEQDLFARYYEHDNRNDVVERLRTRETPREHAESLLLVGFLLGLALPFLIDGIIVSQESSTLSTLPQTSFLIQLWGGFSLVLLLLLLFGVNCWIWHRYKVHYTFVFEVDSRHNLNYRQYLEVPSLASALLTLCLVACFTDISGLHIFLVDVQEFLAEQVERYLVPSHLFMPLHCHSFISLQRPPSLQSFLVCTCKCTCPQSIGSNLVPCLIFGIISHRVPRLFHR